MMIQHNLNAMYTQNRLNVTVSGIKKSTEKLSSGYRINRAADDAAGLSISEKMRAQLRGLSQGIRNTADGISLAATADGYLNEIHDMMHRLSELSVQASNDTYSADEREYIQVEIDQLVQEIDDLTERAEFNGIKLFRGKMTVENIHYSDPEFVTTTPKDPAIVIGSEFGIDPTTGDDKVVYVRGGTNVIQSSTANVYETGSFLNDLNKDPNFPNEGVFVIRVGIPGGILPTDLKAEVRDAVLDFGKLNADGKFSLDDFKAFFMGVPTGATRPDGNLNAPAGSTIPVYAGGIFSDLINADELRFDIDEAGKITIETIGLGGPQAQVGIGITNMTAADWARYNSAHGTSYAVNNVKYANSAIFGATAASSTSNNASALFAGFDLNAWLSNPSSNAKNNTTVTVGGKSYTVNNGQVTVEGTTYNVEVKAITKTNESYQSIINEVALEVLQANYMDCPVFWDFLVANHGGTTFSLTMQQKFIGNPNYIKPGQSGYPALIKDAITKKPIVPNREEPEFLYPSRSAEEQLSSPWLPIIGDTRYLGYPVTADPVEYQTATYAKSISQLDALGATTLRNANGVFNAARSTTIGNTTTGYTHSGRMASDFFASASIGSISSESLRVDRNGNVYFNWASSDLYPISTRGNSSGSATSEFSDGNYRMLVGVAPNGPSYYAPLPSTSTGRVTSGLRSSPNSSVSSSYPARVSQDIGTLEIKISNYSGNTVLPTTATVLIDFSGNPMPFSPSSPPDSPLAIQAMVDYINTQLNAPANHPNPPISFRDSSYVNLLNLHSVIQGKTLSYDDYPVGFAYLDANGSLVIAAAERNFQIDIKEEKTDYPMFGIQRVATVGVPSNVTLNITGSPSYAMSQSVILKAGSYTSAEEFYMANKDAFPPNYTLSVTQNRLVITSKATGAAVSVNNMSVTPSVYSQLLQDFGLVNVYTPERFSPDSSPVKESRPRIDGTWGGGFSISGIDWSSYDELLPPRVIGVDVNSKSLWIQGRDKNGSDQGLFIFLPYLSASVLKFSEYKPPEYELTDEQTEILKDFAEPPTYLGNDSNDSKDVKRGLDVRTRENANLAIDTVASALHIISKERARFGAATHALEHMMSSVTNTHENLTAAESQIRDADMAAAMVELVKHNILLQSAQAILSQDIQAQQAVLQLLK